MAGGDAVRSNDGLGTRTAHEFHQFVRIVSFVGHYLVEFPAAQPILRLGDVGYFPAGERNVNQRVHARHHQGLCRGHAVARGLHPKWVLS